jgi:hypothetical protein
MTRMKRTKRSKRGRKRTEHKKLHSQRLSKQRLTFLVLLRESDHMPSAYVIALVLHFPFFFYVLRFPELNILTLGSSVYIFLLVCSLMLNVLSSNLFSYAYEFFLHCMVP